MKSIFLGQMCFRDQVHIKVCFMSRFFTFDQCFNVCMCACVCALTAIMQAQTSELSFIFCCPVLWNAEPERLTDRVSVLEKKKGKKKYGLLSPFYSSESTKSRPASLGGFYRPMKMDISFSCSGNSDPIQSFSYPR